MTGQRDLFANFERMRREVDELFGDLWERTGYAPRSASGFAPHVDVYYCGEPPRAIVKADLPGVELEEIQLEISGRELKISGERPVPETEGRVYQQLEIATGPFSRVVELGADIVTEQVRATYDDGVLRIELPLRQPVEGVRTVPIERAEEE